MIRSTPLPSDGAAGPERSIGPESIQRWREAIRTSTFGNYHHQMGVALLAAGERAAALAAFERAVATDPGRYSSALRLVRLLEEEGDHEHARAVLERALARDPDAQALALAEEAEDASINAKMQAAVTLMAQALATTERAAAHRPDSVVMLAGHLRNQHEEALRWCDLAAPYVQDQYSLHHQKGFSLLLLNRQEEAEWELQASIAAAPERMSSWYVLGQYHRLRFETEAALHAYDLVWKSKDGLRLWAGTMIASTFLLAGRFQEALDACDAVRKQDSSMKWAVAMRGLVHLCAGNFEAAGSALEEAQQNNSDSSRMRVFCGLLKLLQNRPGEALEDFNGERGDFACLALARLGRARVLLELGNSQDADRLVRLAIQEEGQWLSATLWLLGPLGDALKPLLLSAGYQGAFGRPA